MKKIKLLFAVIAICFFVACSNNASNTTNAAEPKTNKDLIQGNWQSYSEAGNKAIFSFKSGSAELQNFVKDKYDTTFLGAYSFKNNLQEVIMDFGGVMHSDYDIISINDSVMILQDHGGTAKDKFTRIK